MNVERGKGERRKEHAPENVVVGRRHRRRILFHLNSRTSVTRMRSAHPNLDAREQRGHEDVGAQAIGFEGAAGGEDYLRAYERRKDVQGLMWPESEYLDLDLLDRPEHAQIRLGGAMGPQWVRSGEGRGRRRRGLMLLPPKCRTTHAWVVRLGPQIFLILSTAPCPSSFKFCASDALKIMTTFTLDCATCEKTPRHAPFARIAKLRNARRHPHRTAARAEALKTGSSSCSDARARQVSDMHISCRSASSKPQVYYEKLHYIMGFPQVSAQRGGVRSSQYFLKAFFNAQVLALSRCCVSARSHFNETPSLCGFGLGGGTARHIQSNGMTTRNTTFLNLLNTCKTARRDAVTGNMAQTTFGKSSHETPSGIDSSPPRCHVRTDDEEYSALIELHISGFVTTGPNVGEKSTYICQFAALRVRLGGRVEPVLT
ncbi:hypothetical protein B0H11DRAFT_1941991 [Mycena galericulata]|nr:hypothetical protein B0H11DRAFT_1941991 [Mycena galericulata]